MFFFVDATLPCEYSEASTLLKTNHPSGGRSSRHPSGSNYNEYEVITPQHHQQFFASVPHNASPHKQPAASNDDAAQEGGSQQGSMQRQRKGSSSDSGNGSPRNSNVPKEAEQPQVKLF